MEASAKELMVPLLATKDTPDGANLSAGDLGVLLKTIDEIHKKGTSKDIDDVLEYKILVQAEVKDHLRYLTEKAQKDSSKKVPAYDSLNKQLLTLDRGIKFAKFAKSYSDDISKFVEDGVNGEFGDKWDSVDCMAAKYAMLNVLKDINAGVLMSPGGEKLAFAEKRLQ